METLSLRIKYRPLRIGWCLPAGDFAGLRKALRLTHTVWGGRFNPIIPVDLEYSRQLVSLFRVDVLIPVCENENVKAFIEKFPYLPNPFFPSELHIRESSGKVHAQVLDLYHPIRRLYEEHVKNNPQPLFHATLYQWEDDDPLACVLLATFGGFPPKEETGMDYQGLIEKHLAAEVTNLAGRKALPSDSFQEATPNWICCLDLEPHYSVINHWNAPGFYVGCATDFGDLVNYWNIRAADTDLIFYDPHFSQRLDGLRADYLAALRARPKSARAFDDHIAIWSRRENNQIDLAAFGSGYLRCSPTEATWNGLNVKAPVMHFGEKSVLAAVSYNLGKIRVSFSLPEKTCYDKGYFRHQHLVASIAPGIGLYGNERATLMTPFLPELNEHYGRNYYFDWDKTRVEPEGIGVIIDVWREDLTLSALDISSLISKIFEFAGMRARPSQAGLIASRLIQQLGGLQGCRVFKIRGVRDLIKKYKPDQSFTRSGAIQIIRNDPQTGKPSFSEYENLFIESRSAAKLKPEDAFIYLVRHGVFRVGLNFGCPNCNLDFWVTLDDVRTETKCEFCGQNFNITSQLKDRDWRYRRSGLFGKENHQEGGIPVALTLQQMDTAFGLSEMLYTTAMEIEPAGATIRKCETDFVLLTQTSIDNRVQIAIGECKDQDEINEDDVSKLRLAAEALEEKNIQVFVIFAKLGEFTSKELERCEAVNGKYERRLILFTTRELEPYHLYEKAAKEFDIRGYAVSFEDMVNITHTVFYEQRRKPPLT